MAPPKIILGSGVWGYFVEKDEICRHLAEAARCGILQIDSGAHHPYSRPGLAEIILGETEYQELGFVVDSKALFTNGGDGCLTAEAVKGSIDTTMASLKTQRLNIYYALAPDRVTPLEEQVVAFDAQYRLGKFAKLGLCNLQPEMLEKWNKAAEDKGCVKPSVFQGQYNLLCRRYEEAMFPLLRSRGMSFYAFGGIAGGILTGKLTFSHSAEDLKGTRFEVSDTNVIGAFLRNCYDKPCFHDAVRRIEALCEAYDVPIADASLRWLMHHSLLDGDKGDGVIIGPRNMQQLKQNIKACQDGPLPPELAEGLAGVFDSVKDEAAKILVY
ncbi:Aldo/keto reductase [Nemania abortiva]|nr:Aldo/keto reductase [Nemania abortiva]